jgi:signal transduction histidine kinase
MLYFPMSGEVEIIKGDVMEKTDKPCAAYGAGEMLENIKDLKGRYQFLHSLVDEVSDPIVVIGTDFKVKFANKAARAFSAEFVWHDGAEPYCHNLIYNSKCQCSTLGRPCPLIEVVETNKSVVVEHDIELSGGESCSIEVHASPLWDVNGCFLGIVESLRDITERKAYARILEDGHNELERQVANRTRDLLRSNDILKNEIVGRQRIEKILRSERDKFQIMVEAMGQGVHIINDKYIIEYQNEVLRHLFGDKIGHTCYDVYKNRTEPCEVCKMHKAIETGMIQQNEESLRDGRMYLQSYAPFKDIDGDKKCLIVLSDITEQKAYQAETMLTGQLASIGELAAGVAHEINNPINGIINFSQILLDDSTDAASSEIMQRIIAEGERVATIVSNLLAFARQGNGGEESCHEVDVRQVMNDSIALLHHQYKKDGIVFSVSGPVDLPTVWVNPQQLQQVFVNLLSNSRYALNKKFPNRHPEKRLEVTFGEAEVGNRNFVRVRVTDFGCGIPAEILDSVRNPFFSTKEPGEGTGLGLSISDGIIKELKGSLRIKSELGSYTTVVIDIPRFDRGKGSAK